MIKRIFGAGRVLVTTVRRVHEMIVAVAFPYKLIAAVHAEECQNYLT